MANVPRLTAGDLVPVERVEPTVRNPLEVQAELNEKAAQEAASSPGLLSPEDLSPLEEAPLTPLARPANPILTDKAVRASEINPDQVAADRSLANKLNLPPTIVGEDNRADLQKQATQLGIQDIPTNAPVTQRLLTEDDLVSLLGSDDVPNLVGMERAAKQLTFTESLSNGVDLLQTLGWRFVEATGEATGIETLEELGGRGAAENLDEIIGGLKQKQRFLDVKTAGDFFTWMKQTAGEQIPLMAPSLVGGLTLGAAGTAIAPGIGTVIGGTIGVFVPSFVLGVGETQQAIKERDPRVEAPGIAFGAGALIGALDSALPGKVGTELVKAFGLDIAEKAVKLMATEIASRAAKAGAQGLALEGVTEAIQEVISETAAATATDTKIDVDDLTNQVIEAFAAGAFLGGGIGTTTSVVTDTFAKAKRTKQSMDALNDLKSQSKLVSRDAVKGAEVVAEDMRAAGVEEIFIPVDALMEFANQRSEGIPETLRELGVEDALSEAVRGDTDVRIDSAKYAEIILGSPGYDAIAPHVKIRAADKSLNDASEDLVEATDVQQLETELETYDASEGLKERVRETLAKLVPGKATEALQQAPRDALGVLMDLINKIEEGRVSVSAEVRKGRIAQLDEELSVIDQTIDRTQAEIDTRTAEKRPTKRLENRLESLATRRDAKIDEQEGLAFEERQIVQAPTREGQIEAEEITGKKVRQKVIKTKAKVLQDLGVKITKEAIRATRVAFRAGLKAGETLTAQKTAITREINKLPLTDKQKNQLNGRINKAGTEAQLRKAAQAVQSKATVLVEQEQRKQIRRATEKQLSKTAPKRVGGKPVGKFDADTQEVLDLARNTLRLSVDAAQEKLNTALQDPTPSPAGLFERRLLAMAANDPNLSIADAENILFDIVAVKAGGAAAALERLLGRRRARNADVAKAREAVTQGEPTKELTTTGFFTRLKNKGQDIRAAFASSHNGWDEILDILFNKKGVDATSLIQDLRITEQVQDRKGLAIQWEQQTTAIAEKAYELDGYARVMEKHIDDAKRTNFGVFENARGENVRLEYSLSEIRKLWMERQDPLLKEVIEDKNGMAFTGEMQRVLFDTMTDQDKTYVNDQLAFYRKIYPQINAVYRRVYGVNLPFNEFYSPIQRDKGDVTDTGGGDSFGSDRILTDEMTFRRSLPKQLKTREQGLTPLLRRSDVGAMHRYLHDMSWFVKTTERVLHQKSVFDSQPLRKDIKAQHGNSMVKTIDSFLEDFGTGYVARGVVGEQIFGGFNRLFSSSVLALKPTIGTKQLVSWFAMADNVPTKDFIAAHADFFKSPKRAKEIVKFLFDNSATLQERGSSLDFELAKVGSLEEPVFRWKKQEKWEKIKFAFIHYGDRVPIYAGGWAVYKHARSQGKTKEQAIRVFEDALSTTQQSVDIDKLSNLQRASPLGRTLTMFMTARMALLRGEVRAFRQFKRGKISMREFGKRIAYYHFVMPMFIQFIASGFEWEPDRQLVAATLGQLNSLVLIGDAMVFATELALTEDARESVQEIPLFDVVGQLVQGLNDAFTFDNIEELTEALLELAGVAGQLAGQPVDQVVNIIGGVDDVVEGDVEQGLKRIYGFSKKVAEESSR